MKNLNKKLAVLSATALLLSSLPLTSLVASADSTEAVYSTDFEDGDVSAFSKRGDNDTSVIAAATDSGNTYMSVTGRSKSWNGPQISLKDYCEVGEQYLVTAKVKAPWYATITLSMQKNPTGGEASYSNLVQAVSQGDWVSYEETTITMPADCDDVYLYFECSDANVEIDIDDFTITKVPEVEIQEDIASLKDVYADYFKLGTACTADELASKTNQKLIKKHFNSITPGNEMKPDSLLDKTATIAAMNDGDENDPQVNLSNARSILNFARDNNISVRGHVLVWHQQTPDWFFRVDYDTSKDFVDEETMLTRMENYIKNVFAAVKEEYPTVDFYAWDVVNECWLDDGSYRTGGANSGSESTSPWVKIFGDNSFIKYAFQFAKKYAPEGCKLYYNDFNEYMPQKTAAIINMVNEINADEQLIDGLGLQSHLDVSFPSISVYEKALKQYCELGIDVQITELDATVSGNSDENFETQAQYYSDIMDLAVKYSDSISAVVFWGTVDSTSWRSSRYPLLFNGDFSAKPSYYSIVDGIEYTPAETTEKVEETTSAVTETTADTSLVGDVNLDNKITVSDAVMLSKWIIKKADSSLNSYDFSLTKADMNGDGKVNVLDLALLKAAVK